MLISIDTGAFMGSPLAPPTTPTRWIRLIGLSGPGKAVFKGKAFIQAGSGGSHSSNNSKKKQNRQQQATLEKEKDLQLAQITDNAFDLIVRRGSACAHTHNTAPVKP